MFVAATSLGYDIVVSSHTGKVWLADEGDSRLVVGPFASVQEAKDSIEDAWIASVAD